MSVRDGCPDLRAFTEHKDFRSLLNSTRASTFYQYENQTNDTVETERSEASYSETSFGEPGHEMDLIPQTPAESILLFNHRYRWRVLLEVSHINGYCPGFDHLDADNPAGKHICADLAADICTQDDCRHPLFESRNRWLSHDLKEHRRQWVCRFCKGSSHSMHLQYSYEHGA